MPIVKIRNKNTNSIIYSGLFSDIKECLEYAVSKNIDLSGADLSYQNLCNAQLDGALLRQACFNGANLTGANMSETVLDGAQFHHASLYNSCLCDASLKYCDFTDADFGATDIYGSDLSASSFSTLSALMLPFSGAASQQKCLYKTTHGKTIKFSTPPLYISGLECSLVRIGEHIMIGSQVFDCMDFTMATDRDKGKSYITKEERTAHFINKNAALLAALSSYTCKDVIDVHMAANQINTPAYR